MPRTTTEGYVQDPPEAVFDLLADCRNELRWHPDVTAMEKVTEGPIGRGTEFDAVYRLFGRTRVVITEYDRPRLLDFDARGRSADIRVRLELEPEGGGTRLRGLSEMRAKGPMKLLTPVFALMLPREMRKRPEQVHAALEQAEA